MHFILSLYNMMCYLWRNKEWWYHAGVWNISRRAGGQEKHIIPLNNEAMNGDDPMATVRLRQRSLSSQSLGKV